MDPRKKLLQRAAAEGVNDRYILPQKYRDRTAHVTTYSSLLLLAEVRGWLSVNEQAMFKGTSIGHLLSVPEDSKFSGTIIHFLLSREIHIDDKPDEMHFKVGGKILHFGKREFALITGLSFMKPQKAFVSPANPSSLMTTHFPYQYRINGSEVKALLSKKNPTCTPLDRVKLALLLVVHRFLMGRQDGDTINLVYWHLVDDLEEFNKYPWGDVTYDIEKLKSPLLYQAIENSDAGGNPTYKVFGVPQPLLVWAPEIMPGLLNLCGKKIEIRRWQPHMLCVYCTKSPYYADLIRTLEVNDVHVCSDIMWQKGDVNQLIVLGLEEGSPEVVDVDSEDSFQEREDSNQGYEVPESVVYQSKKRKITTEEPMMPAIPILPTQESGTKDNENDTPHTRVKDSLGKDVHIGNLSSCSEKETTGFEPLEVLELFKVPMDFKRDASTSNFVTPDPTLLTVFTSVDVTPPLIGSTSAPTQEKVEGFEFVGDLKIPEEFKTLYDKISKEHGHMATKNVIKFNDAMLLTCVTSLLKIISEMKTVLGAGVSVALLDRWEGFIRDAEILEFNIEWLRERFDRLKNCWKSSFKVDIDIESHEKVLDAMLGKYVGLSTRKEELETELSEVNIQIEKAEAEISSEQEAIREKQTQKIQFQRQPVLRIVLNELNF